MSMVTDYVPEKNGDVSRTKQSFKDSCDIHQIIKRFERTGLMDHVSKAIPRFLDVSEVSDYKSALDQVKAAETYFMGLPAKVREVFDNDATTFLAAYDGGLDEAQLKALGLEAIDPPKEKAPAPVEPAPLE